MHGNLLSLTGGARLPASIRAAPTPRASSAKGEGFIGAFP
jgi:hypothetical protein